MHGAVAPLQIRHPAADFRALAAQFGDRLRPQGLADVIAVRSAPQLALSGAIARDAFGFRGARRGQLLVQRRDFLLSQHAAAGVGAQQVVGRTILLNGGFRLENLLAQVIDLSVQKRVGALGGAQLLVELMADVAFREGVGDSRGLGGALAGVADAEQKGLAHPLDLQALHDAVHQGVAHHGRVGGSLDGNREFRVLVELQLGDHVVGQHRRSQDFDLSIHGLISRHVIIY